MVNWLRNEFMTISWILDRFMIDIYAHSTYVMWYMYALLNHALQLMWCSWSARIHTHVMWDLFFFKASLQSGPDLCDAIWWKRGDTCGIWAHAARASGTWVHPLRPLGQSVLEILHRVTRWKLTQQPHSSGRPQWKGTCSEPGRGQRRLAQAAGARPARQPAKPWQSWHLWDLSPRSSR